MGDVTKGVVCLTSTITCELLSHLPLCIRWYHSEYQGERLFPFSIQPDKLMGFHPRLGESILSISVSQKDFFFVSQYLQSWHGMTISGSHNSGQSIHSFFFNDWITDYCAPFLMLHNNISGELLNHRSKINYKIKKLHCNMTW